MSEIMNSLSSSMNTLEWRTSKVLELSSQGYNQSEISRMLQISQPTINRDLAYLRQQAKSTIKRYIDERLPKEPDYDEDKDQLEEEQEEETGETTITINKLFELIY